MKIGLLCHVAQSAEPLHPSEIESVQKRQQGDVVTLLLEETGHFVCDHTTETIATQAVRTARLPGLHFLDIRLGHLFDRLEGF